MSPSPPRLLEPEQIALRAGEDWPRLLLPSRAEVFAARALRLRELSAGHAMRDYLLFLALLCEAQHEALQRHPEVPLPTQAQLDAAAREGRPALSASALHAAWPRDARWRQSLRGLLDAVLARLPDSSPACRGVQAVRDADDDWLEQQADRLQGGVTLGLDVASAPLVAAGLQLYWTHLVIATGAAHAKARPAELPAAAFGFADDPSRCPCCGSLPSVSLTRIGGEVEGYRYLHCSLCSAQWHMVRVKCSHCQSTKGISYQSLQPTDQSPQAATAGGERASRRDAVQAECCSVCGHYLKILHMAADLHVEPIADDLASLTLDLLLAQDGLQRHGSNLLLLFGDPDEEPAAPDPAGAAAR